MLSSNLLNQGVYELKYHLIKPYLIGVQRWHYLLLDDEN